jgi:hypothetical protein
MKSILKILVQKGARIELMYRHCGYRIRRLFYRPSGRLFVTANANSTTTITRISSAEIVGFLQGLDDEAKSMKLEIGRNGRGGRLPIAKWMQIVEHSLIFCGEVFNSLLDADLEVDDVDEWRKVQKDIVQNVRQSCGGLFDGLCEMLEVHRAFNYSEELEPEEEKVLFDMAEDMISRYFFIVRKYGEDNDAIKLFDEFIKKDAPLSSEVYDEVLDMLDKLEMHEDILGVADAIHNRKVDFTPKSLEICLHAACCVDGISAVKILKDAYSQGHDCDESVIGPVVHRCIVQGEMDAAIEAMKISKIERITNPLFYDNLVKDVLSTNDDQFAIEVIPFLRNIENVEGLSRECVQNIVLVCLNAADFNRAFQVMDVLLEMLRHEDLSEGYLEKRKSKKNIAPIYLFEYVLHVLKSAQNHAFARNILRQMRYFNVEMAQGTFQALIKCLSEIGDVEESKRILKEVHEFNMRVEDKKKIILDKEVFAYLLACCETVNSPTDWVEEELSKQNLTKWDVEDFFYKTEGEEKESEEFDFESEKSDAEADEENESGEDSSSDSDVQVEEEDFEEPIDYAEEDEKTKELIEKYSSLEN